MKTHKALSFRWREEQKGRSILTLALAEAQRSGSPGETRQVAITLGTKTSSPPRTARSEKAVDGFQSLCSIKPATEGKERKEQVLTDGRQQADSETNRLALGPLGDPEGLPSSASVCTMKRRMILIKVAVVQNEEIVSSADTLSIQEMEAVFISSYLLCCPLPRWARVYFFLTHGSFTDRLLSIRRCAVSLGNVYLSLSWRFLRKALG